MSCIGLSKDHRRITEGLQHCNRIDDSLHRHTCRSSGKSGASTGQNQSDEICNDLEGYDPPGIIDLDFVGSGLCGIADDVFDLLSCETYFHIRIVFRMQRYVSRGAKNKFVAKTDVSCLTLTDMMNSDF